MDTSEGQHVLPQNDTLHLPGRLQGTCVTKDRNAGPVKCKGWFAAAPRNYKDRAVVQSHSVAGDTRFQSSISSAQLCASCESRFSNFAFFQSVNVSRNSYTRGVGRPSR